MSKFNTGFDTLNGEINSFDRIQDGELQIESELAKFKYPSVNTDRTFNSNTLNPRSSRTNNYDNFRTREYPSFARRPDVEPLPYGFDEPYIYDQKRASVDETKLPKPKQEDALEKMGVLKQIKSVDFADTVTPSMQVSDVNNTKMAYLAIVCN